jgi:hypothetical protein
MLVHGAPKSKLPGAREDFNPALLEGLFIQSLNFKGPLRIVCNMWKVFTRPTCASDFFLLFSNGMTQNGKIFSVLAKHYP